MCGIAGLFHHGRTGPVNREILSRMNACLVHRGPDEAGEWASGDGRVGLAMRRLAIIDVKTGQQPLSNGDGTVWIVFNGEVYNFKVLRAELEAKGRRFKTHSDTETILHLYEEEGVDCVKRLRGMFAFALWDDRRGRLLLARDRFGKKPLVYSDVAGRLAWASEISALRALPDLSTETDPEALGLYLGLQYIPSPRTIYKSIRKLPPAHRLVAEQGRVTVERYWDLPTAGPIPGMGIEEAKEALREKLQESVRLRMISEVPLGAFLSGGVDSAAVVAFMSRHSAQPVKTFSIGFEDEDYSELADARETSHRFGTDHTEFIVKPEMAETLPLLAKHYGEPFGDPSALPTYYVARETRRHVTVALNGDGGDEDFAGYLRHRAEAAAVRAALLPGAAWRAAAGLLDVLPGADMRGLVHRLHRFTSAAGEADPAARHLGFAGLFPPDLLARLCKPTFLKAAGPGAALRYFKEAFAHAPSKDRINRVLHVDFHTYLPECLMPKVDIAAMAASLEARSPLLDHEFVELVYRMPGKWKLRGFTQAKWIFKEALRDVLPPEILSRPKRGFGLPLGAWFRQDHLRKLFEDTVLSPEALRRGYFQEAPLKDFFEEHLSARRDHGHRLWALLMLELWHRNA